MHWFHVNMGIYVFPCHHRGITFHVCVRMRGIQDFHWQRPDTYSWDHSIDIILCFMFKDFYPTLSSVETRLHMCYLNSCLGCRNKAEILILWDITQLHQGKNHTALFLKWRLFLCSTTKDFYSLRLSSSISGPFHCLAGVLSSVNIPTASPLQHVMAEKCGCDSSQATGASCLGQHRRLCSRHTLSASVQVCNIICGTTGSVISAGSGATLM